MKIPVVLLSCLLSSCLLSGCYTLTTQADTSDKPMLVNRSVMYANAPKSRFVSQGTYFFLFWGLVGNENDVIQEKLLQQLGSAQALQDIKVTSEFVVSDMLISWVTLGMVSPRTFSVSGEVIRYED